MAAPTQAQLKSYVSDVRQQALLAGRAPKKVLTYTLVTVIVDETDALAYAKFEEYKRYVSYDGALVFMSGWTGIDFGQYAPADLVRRVETNAIVSAVETLVWCRALSAGQPPGRWLPRYREGQARAGAQGGVSAQGEAQVVWLFK